jgi:hypothetical protein
MRRRRPQSFAGESASLANDDSFEDKTEEHIAQVQAAERGGGESQEGT